MRACLAPLLVCLLASLSTRAQSPNASFAMSADDRTAMQAVTHDMCQKRVALLGEAPTHGDGHTETFKVELVKTLITHCHYNAVAFEASSYEFIAFDRALRSGTATPGMLSRSVGGLWKFDKEFQPLVPFLFEQAKAGRVRLFGLDDQIGGLGQTFTNEDMFVELSRPLEQVQAAACRAGFQRYIMSDYPPDQPYGKKEHDELLDCIHSFRQMAEKTNARKEEERTAMLDNLYRLVEADLGSGRPRYQAREQAMYDNFDRVTKLLPSSAKIIVWGASVHLGNNPGAVSRSGAERSLGGQVKARFVSSAFSLGFAAAGGSYRTLKTKHNVDAPPADSLEAMALSNNREGAVYVGADFLQKLGEVHSYALEHKLTRANWNNVFDGVVVFREEWPSHICGRDTNSLACSADAKPGPLQ